MANLSSSNCPRCELKKLQFHKDLATEQSNTLLNVAVYMPTDMAGVGMGGIARGANTSMVAHNIIFKFVNVDRSYLVGVANSTFASACGVYQPEPRAIRDL